MESYSKALMKTSKYQQALVYLNKLVSAVSYNRNYLEQRILAYEKPGKKDFASRDQEQLSRFDQDVQAPDTLGR